MLVREWIVRTPERHIVRLELLTGRLIVRLDGIVQPTPLSGWSSKFGNEVVIDNISYTLTRGLPQRRGEYELVRTADMPELSLINRRPAGRLIRAVAGLVFGGLCFSAIYYVRPFLRRFDSVVSQIAADPSSGAVLMVLLFIFSVVCFVGSVYHVNLWWIETSKCTAKDETTTERSVGESGGPPRTGAYFRPLLADIAATAARWKGRIFGRRFGRGRVSNSKP